MLIGRIKTSLNFAFYYSGLVWLYRWTQNLLYGQDGIIVLAYHRIGEKSADFLNMKMPPALFEKQVRFLKKHFNIISLEDAFEILNNRKKKVSNAVVITFDDGYLDNFELLYPILKKHNVPATIFLSIEGIESGKLLWWDRIIHLLFKSRLDHLDLKQFGLRQYDLTSEEARSRACDEICRKVKRLAPQKREELILQISKCLGQQNVAGEEDRLMNWDEVNALNGGLVSYGSHGMTHTILTNLPHKAIRWELSESRKIMEKRLGQSPQFFAFPNGRTRDYNAEVMELVRECGYQAALTLIDGHNRPQKNLDFFNLKRRLITTHIDEGPQGHFSPADFVVNILGVWDILRRKKLNRSVD